MKLRHLIAATCAAVATAASAAGLTPSNYVEVGDTIVDMLDTSSLAFSTMLLGLNDTPRVVRASFASPSSRAQPFSSPCPGGGAIHGSVADRDGSGNVSVRDRFVTVFESCRIDDELISGSSEFIVAAHHVDNGVETTELEFHFRHLGSDAMRWTGSAHATLKTDARSGGDQYTVTYRDMAVTRASHAAHWNFPLAVQRPPLGDYTARIDGSMTLEHDLLRLTQDDLFVIGARRMPRAGQLTATDAEGNRLEVEAATRRYRYRYFTRANRGTSPDSSSQSRPHGR